MEFSGLVQSTGKTNKASTDIDIMDFFPAGRKPREAQIKGLRCIEDWLLNKDTRFAGIDAPTGVGKSMKALAAAKFANKLFGGQVWILTQNKNLQDQYIKDFPDDLFSLKGLDNYACHHDIGKTCATSKCGRIPAKTAEQKKKGSPAYCSKSCDYDIAHEDARVAPVLLLNVAKALTLLKNKNPVTRFEPKFIVYDEGHTVESQLDSESSLEIKPDALEKVGLKFSDYFKSPLNIGNIEENGILDGLLELKSEVMRKNKTEIEAPDDFRDIQMLKRTEALLNKIESVQDAIYAEVVCVSCSTEHLDIRPLQVHKVFDKFFNDCRVLFLSATLLSHQGFANTIGREPEDMEWLSLPSPFPRENRPLIRGWQVGAAPINYGNKDKQEPFVIERIKYFMDKHKGERGIIHTHTYGWATNIYNKIPREYQKRLLFAKTSKEQKEILEIHESSRDTVLISPSMVEGVDLKDDLARFCMMVKVPYLPSNDPVIEYRRDSSAVWYQFRSIMTIVQACGRGVRSSEDHCSIYFLDPMFDKFINQNKKLFPPWFLEGLVKGYQGPC